MQILEVGIKPFLGSTVVLPSSLSTRDGDFILGHDYCLTNQAQLWREGTGEICSFRKFYPRMNRRKQMRISGPRVLRSTLQFEAKRIRYGWTSGREPPVCITPGFYRPFPYTSSVRLEFLVDGYYEIKGLLDLSSGLMTVLRDTMKK